MHQKQGGVLQEYLEFKRAYPDFIIFYQLGDFYEVFFDDAKEVASHLSITLTSRDKNDPNPVPMCGVPVHSVESYVSKLLDKGISVAIVAQKKVGKTIERRISQLLTPGVRVDLESDVSQGIIASIMKTQNHFEVCLAFVNDKTVINRKVDDLVDAVVLLSTYDAQEILLPTGQVEDFHLLLQNLKAVPRKVQFLGSAFETLRTYLQSLKVEIDTKYWKVDNSNSNLTVNASCLRSLDVLNPDSELTLFSFLNQCVTPMGSALLKRRFLSPIKSKDQILEYHDDIAKVLQNYPVYHNLHKAISTTLNVSKLILRARANRVSLTEARKLKTLISKLRCFLDEYFEAGKPVELSKLAQSARKLLDIKDLIEDLWKLLEPLNESTSSTLGGYDVFLPGHFPDLDELVSLKTQCDSILESIEKAEREKTGIQNLRVKVTQNFGIVFEVTNSHKHLVPSTYIRKQTLVNCERFTSQELLELEEKIQNIDSQILALSEEKWSQIQQKLAERCDKLDLLGEIVGELDLLITLASVSKREGFVRPTLVDDPVIKICRGFHPLLRKLLQDSYQVNDFNLEADRNFFILTGPNMGGKSSFLRQIGLTVILNQIGCYVPAQEATLGIFEAVRVRIGANDQIFKGMSTFMSECVDIAEIVRSAGPRTLVLIDELGRGTNAEEGLAFCVATLRFLTQRGTPLILATHFHQLSEIFPNAQFIQTEVLETDSGPLFTHRIKEGVLNHSYSWFVAEKAGLPPEVVDLCKVYLSQYENSLSLKPDIEHVKFSEETINQDLEKSRELSDSYKIIVEVIDRIDPNSITPKQALDQIYYLKDLLRSLRGSGLAAPPAQNSLVAASQKIG